MKKPTISASRAAEIFNEMVGLRRIYCDDSRFFRMSDFWSLLAEGGGETKIKTYRSSEKEDYKRKAGVVAFAGNTTLVVDEALMLNAVNGCKLSNYILAHEFAHLALNHHARGAVIKNFQLYASPVGLANIPPTAEELEANFAAVFFQCGVSLLNNQRSAVELANRAFSDVYYVKKAVSVCCLDVFKRELAKFESRAERVVL